MRIPIFYNPLNKKKYHLHLERAYNCKEVLIPIGSDCHVAHVLEKLHLRKYSLPFDYMGMSGIHSINYVLDNFKNNFKYFIADIKVNKNGIVYAEKYPKTTFKHYKSLLNKEETHKMFKRRIQRLYKLIERGDVHYINCVPSWQFDNENKLQYFENAINIFCQTHKKENDKLSIYFRFDGEYDENYENITTLIKRLNTLKNVCATTYVREIKKDPTWGNPKYYPKLLEDLGVKISTTTIKVYLKKS